jgi:peptide chain release factor 1
MTLNLLRSKLLSLGDNLLNTTDHVESGLGKVIVLALKDLLERADGVLQRNETTLDTSEDLSNSEGLGKESLNLTGTLDSKLVSLRQLIHTQNGNDILKRLVRLEGLLDLGSNIVVLLANDGDIQKTRLGIKGIDSGVDTQLRNGTRQDGGGIQVSKGGGRSRIGQIISRDVDGLDGSDGTLLGSGNTLLQGTHISGKGGLVTDSGGNTTQKGRHLGTGLSETENVVNEEQHILTLLITEVLSNGKTSKSDTGTGSRGLVHLTEDKSDLGLTLKVNDTSLLHLTVQIVTLTGSLTDTGENRETTMGLGNVVNQLLNENGLTDTGTTEETNLTTTGVGGKEIDNLDTSLKNLSGGRLLSEGGGLSVDGKVLSSLNGSTLIDGLTNDVDNSTKGTTADGNGNGGTGVNNGLTTDETLSTVHGNSTDSVLTQMLGNLEDELLTVLSLELKSVKNGGKVVLGKLDIDDSTNDGSIKDSKVSY